jgi:hypothetical protein
VGLQVFENGNACVGVNVIKVVSHSKNTPRYDDVFLSSYNSCISPKYLFSAFSNVAEEAEEYAQIPPLASQNLAPAESRHLVYGPNSPSFGVTALKPTSIMPGLHAVRTPGHAATGGAACGTLSPGQSRTPLPGLGKTSVQGRGVPVCGDTAATRPAVHGIDKLIHTPVPNQSATTIKSTVQAKVKNSLYVQQTFTNLGESFFEHTNNTLQGDYAAVPTMVGMIKEVPKTKLYTKEQIVAFGGIQEEASRDVRSSGRLRTQPNADMTQMERAMMIAKKRAETPVIGMSTSKLNSISSFSEEHIIENARSLGVSLGVSTSDCIKSAKLIKDFELQRSLTMLKCNDQSEKNQANDILCLAVSRASDLCNDLEDEENLVSDVDVQIPQVVSREKKQRKRKSYDKKNVRRSNRVRVKPSKLQ